jgi:biopolymer transport protein TolR
MAIAIRDEGAKVNSNINVTPMVDVMLVLLIIFMVITPMLQKDVTVDLAKVNSPEQMTDADKEDAIVVAITRDGGIFLGRDKVEPDQLTNKIKDRIASRNDKRVYVRSDARAKYKNVVEVVDNVRSAGVDDLGLLTEQRQQQHVRPPGAPGAPGATSGGTE